MFLTDLLLVMFLHKRFIEPYSLEKQNSVGFQIEPLT